MFNLKKDKICPQSWNLLPGFHILSLTLAQLEAGCWVHSCNGGREGVTDGPATVPQGGSPNVEFPERGGRRQPATWATGKSLLQKPISYSRGRENMFPREARLTLGQWLEGLAEGSLRAWGREAVRRMGLGCV